MICRIATGLFLLIFGGGGVLKGTSGESEGWGMLEQSMGREALLVLG